MKLTEEQIQNFFDTLVKIIEDRENVSISHSIEKK